MPCGAIGVLPKCTATTRVWLGQADRSASSSWTSFPVLCFSSPVSPLPQEKMQKQKGTHTKFYWGTYLQGQG